MPTEKQHEYILSFMDNEFYIKTCVDWRVFKNRMPGTMTSDVLFVVDDFLLFALQVNTTYEKYL